MKKEQIKSLFDSQFKFTVGQQVRHKADTSSYHPDMSLLILHRVLVESQTDDNEVFFERVYICRTIKFSGSGQTFQFNEKELLSVQEWNETKAKEDQEREQMRDAVKFAQRDIYEAFGVKKDTVCYLVNDKGIIDKTTKYRPTGTGFSKTKDRVELYLSEVDTLESGNKKATVTSPAQIHII